MYAHWLLLQYHLEATLNDSVRSRRPFHIVNSKRTLGKPSNTQDGGGAVRALGVVRENLKTTSRKARSGDKIGTAGAMSDEDYTMPSVTFG